MKRTNNWFEFAREDLIVAKASLKEQVFNLACFHAQQGVEKMLKGYLTCKDQRVPKIHFLDELLELCIKMDARFNELKDVCNSLDDYYIPTRYPDALPGTSPQGMPGKEEAREAIAGLEKVMNFMQGKL